jgi:DnaJ homolog subfamily C member 19
LLKWLVVVAVIWAAWKLLAKPRYRTGMRLAPEPIPQQEARYLLDLPPGADEQAIREAHRRKVAAVHPDRGGSDELTRELNAARDLLLRGE